MGLPEYNKQKIMHMFDKVLCLMGKCLVLIAENMTGWKTSNRRKDKNNAYIEF